MLSSTRSIACDITPSSGRSCACKLPVERHAALKTDCSRMITNHRRSVEHFAIRKDPRGDQATPHGGHDCTAAAMASSTHSISHLMQRQARGSDEKRKSPALVGPKEGSRWAFSLDGIGLGWVEVESGKGMVALYLCTGTATVSRSAAGSAGVFSAERDGEIECIVAGGVRWARAGRSQLTGGMDHACETVVVAVAPRTLWRTALARRRTDSSEHGRRTAARWSGVGRERHQTEEKAGGRRRGRGHLICSSRACSPDREARRGRIFCVCSSSSSSAVLARPSELSIHHHPVQHTTPPAPGTCTRTPLATLTTKLTHHPHSPTQRRIATRPSPSPEGAHPLLLITTMALGGLGAVLLSGHPSLSLGHVISQVDLRSVFFAVVFVIIVLVLGA